MDTLLMSSTMERTADKRFRISWTKKTVPLKRSVLFTKVKHSEEWHQSIEATSGVLRPSDTKFPYASLRSHTDSYLQKKAKLSQADIDIRIGILVEGHGSKDIAIAAVSHVITAKTLRSLLSAELNVAHASYWGLDTWLQCLIAANNGNPASVTDLEARCARMMLPYASHGASAAGLYLQGVCAAMRQSTLSTLKDLPEFVVLLRRAFTDYAAQLEGFRLRYDWNAAHAATSWLKELITASATGRSMGMATPEHLFDTFFPVWRIWASWQPDTKRLTSLAARDSSWIALIGDFVSLEGPDIITGKQGTIRDGLVAQYEEGKQWLQYQSLVIYVPNRTKESLRTILHRVGTAMDTIDTAASGCPSLLDFFRHLMIAQTITEEGLTLFEAVCGINNPRSEDIYTSIQDVYTNRECLDGEHILSLQQLLRTLDEPSAKALRTAMIQPWLSRGIEKCMQSCQAAVKEHTRNYPDWIRLALELHDFGIQVKESPHIFPLLSETTKAQLQLWLSVEHMETTKDILEVLQERASSSLAAGIKKEEATEQMKTLDSKADQLRKRAVESRHPLEKIFEDFYTHRCLELGDVDPETQDTIDSLLRIWKSSGGQVVDNDRRSLAILVSKLIIDVKLRNECLTEIAIENRFMRPPAFIKDLLAIMQQYETERAPATVTMIKLLAESQAWIKCWKSLLFTWLARDSKFGVAKSSKFLDYTLRTMRAAEWLAFMHTLETLFNGYVGPPGFMVPAIFHHDFLAWKSQLSRFANILTKLEDRLSDGNVDESVQYILSCGGGPSSELFVSILESLDESPGELVEGVMYLAVGKLSPASKNVREVKNCVHMVKDATADEAALYKKIWSVCQGDLGIPERSNYPAQTKDCQKTVKSVQTRKNDLSPAVREVMIAGYLQDDTIRSNVKMAIECIAVLFELKIYKADIPAKKLNKATKFWGKIEAEMLQETERLDGLVKHLKQVDPQGTLLFLDENKIPDIPDQDPLGEELRQLPLDVINVVERLADNRLEISFPLAGLPQLYRNVMDVPKEAAAVLLTFETGCQGIESRQCSAQFDCSATKIETEKEPASNVFLWHLLRQTRFQLQAGAFRIEDLHCAIKTIIERVGHTCVSCGCPQNIGSLQLLRPAPCTLKACQDAWSSLPLNLRLPEIKSDPLAIDTLLSGIYNAAVTLKPELLPGAELLSIDIRRIAHKLPTLTVMSHAVNLSAILPSYDIHADRLITWSCTLFPGILASARGTCKIPNLPPGTHQFVLSSCSPAQEAVFASKIPTTTGTTKTTVLFHGTCMNRLPAILAQGLKICSGTSLQRVGAVHGKGIYLADEPATSFPYSQGFYSWNNSSLSTMRLMLGCEVVGAGKRVSAGIHAVTDEQSVMVRYLFLFPSEAKLPVARHIVPAMESGIRALRSGAV
ncbi:hypothetical protein J1614_000232 [Plenodomus biglobosus]|nr:hypothetical protein J1614_000232 [Plenodomus biglobosus]